MLGYIMVGTNDLERAGKFYDRLLGELGAKRDMESDDFIVWNMGEGKTSFSIAKPYDGNPATVGNGSMMAFYVSSPDQVDKMHALALKIGATNEGAPGKRDYDEHFYAGYFRDLDGNKMNFFYYPL